MSACCSGCEKGNGCSVEKPSLPPDLIIPGPEPSTDGVLAMTSSLSEGHDEDSSWSGRRLRAGVPVPVNTRLKLAHAESNASDALALGECNAGSVDLVLFVLNSLTSVEAVLEGTIDGENFSRISSTVFSAAGYARFRFRNVAFRLVRLYYTATGSAGGIGFVATTINGSRN
jgi:hypothetical protein